MPEEARSNESTDAARNDPDEPRKLTPFQVIHRGEDTVDRDNDVTFADFRPKVLPSDTPDELEPVEIPLPKDESVTEPAPSSESSQNTEPPMSETTVPEPADEAGGNDNTNESSKPNSSSGQKSG